jgi:hypothetical protein
MSESADLPDRPEPPEPRDEVPDLEPARPEEEGVPDRSTDPMQLEPARLLANDARVHLRDQGFDDEQILAWATTYVAEYGSGGVEEFLAWIDEAQDRP